ncbi:MAG: alpha-glucan family phosphorylase [Phycisphaerae bacterium]|jgi:starch phosphorylase
MTFKSIFVYPKYPDNLQHLYELASNLWSTWNYNAIDLFYRVDAQIFRDVNHNPLKLLHSLSKERFDELSSDKGFVSELDAVWKQFQNYLQYTGASKDGYNFKENDAIAYFSMEFGLHESIHTYAGGLGILAGDYLKGVSDLGLPIIGIGLLYKFGYFAQHIDINGRQQEAFDRFEDHLVPIRELHDSQGNSVYVNVKILNDDIKVKLWKIDIGRTYLILLDTNIEDNPADLRDITNELYVGDVEKRIQQELVLGIGGIKALELLGKEIKAYHFNEGHSAFAIIGRLRDLIINKKLSFPEAKAVIRASTVFTTHTPVIAGNENFSTKLVKKYLEPRVNEIGLDFDKVAELGYINGNKDVFWLPAFAMRFSKYINGVAEQHAEISRKMWANLFPERPIAEIPISAITNGVHTSWISQPFSDMFNRYLRPHYVHCDKKTDVWKNIYNIPDEELWEEHRRNKRALINFIRRQFNQQSLTREKSRSKKPNANLSLNTDYLTIVFARRFATYKRPTLLLKDKDRFCRILTDQQRPVQMIFAGKAHPSDTEGKEMIKEIIDFAREYNVEDRVLFLENYDMNASRHLCWGADIWLNHPSRYMEASGTSGMKAAMNGVLHLSTLEGWWPEAYNGENGWAISAGNLFNDENLQTVADANQLYDLLENEIAELYYSRNDADIPHGWVAMMKNSIASVCRDFNMNRVLCDYMEKSYVPAMEGSARLSEDNYELLKQAIEEEKELLRHWGSIKITSFSTSIEQKGRLEEGESMDVECGIQFGQARPELFDVELFYMYKGDNSFKVLPMKLASKQGDVTSYKYSLGIEGYGSQSLNVRIKPANAIVADIHPELIKWKD